MGLPAEQKNGRSDPPGGAYGRTSILVRMAVLSWIVTILALGLFILFIIPYQESILIDRMEFAAEVVATSLDEVTVNSIVLEDYSRVVDHCMKVVRDRPSVLFLVITRNDGFSLLHTADTWSHQTLDGHWKLAGGSGSRASFVESDLVGEQVFQYTYPLRYTGIDWGWIHIGLSLEQFAADLRSIYVRTILLGVLCVLISSAVSLVFARRLNRPILQLDAVSRRVAAGDLDVRVDIDTNDEVGSLARSFNQMTHVLREAREELEERVDERTAELSDSNRRLQQEIAQRQQVEEALRESEEQYRDLVESINDVIY